MTRLALLLPLALLAGCTEDVPKPKAAPAPAAEKASEPPAGLGRGGNTNYQAGGGATQAVRQAARRAVAINDMANLGKFVTQQEIELGKMPSAAEITAALKADPSYRTIAGLIADGTIVLTGSKNKSGLWAYETEADTKGGIGLVAGVPNRYSADEIKNLKQGG